MSARSFASRMLVELRKLDERASALEYLAKGKEAAIGFKDGGEFVPLLCLGGASPKFNKMMLFVNDDGYWRTTCHKGTPKMLAELLVGEFNHLWTIPLSMVNWKPDKSIP